MMPALGKGHDEQRMTRATDDVTLCCLDFGIESEFIDAERQSCIEAVMKTKRMVHLPFLGGLAKRSEFNPR